VEFGVHWREEKQMKEREARIFLRSTPAGAGDIDEVESSAQVSLLLSVHRHFWGVGLPVLSSLECSSGEILSYCCISPDIFWWGRLCRKLLDF
jgi:hypothetical protein